MKIPGQKNRAARSLGSMLAGIVVLALSQPFIWGAARGSVDRWHQSLSQDEQLQDLDSRLAVIANQLQTQESVLDQLDVVVPLPGDTPQVIERVEQLADDYNVFLQIRTIAQENEAEAGYGIVPLSVDLRVSGPPTRLLEFLAALEYLPELTEVRQWALTPVSAAPGEDLGSASYNLELDIVFYLQTPPDAGTN